jgi:poly(3-hydroxybutyrate) depolymerase
VTVLTLAGCAPELTGPQIDAEVTRRSPGTHHLMNFLPSGGAIRYTLYVPTIAEGARVPLVVAAHFGGEVTPWLGGDFADLLVVPGFSSLPAVIVAPDAGSAGGWSIEDEAGVKWLARELRSVYPVDPAKVVMTGYSAGGAQTWLLANRNQDFFTAAIPMSARPRATDSPWRIPVYVIHSRDDELIPLATVETYVAGQRAAGAPLDLHVVSGMSHYQTAAFIPALREASSWLAARWR